MNTLRVYIGWDSREDIAYQVAKASLEANASIPVEVIPLKLDELRQRGLYSRETDPLASTEFTYSRFLVPHLAGYEGWALFCDCDFLFFGDVTELRQYMWTEKAVCCVKRDYQPTDKTKMDGIQQTNYPRKNWSSFMLFNCGHFATKRLTPQAVNEESGAYLHRMQWVSDDEIGSIPEEWNWLEGWSKVPELGYPKAVHYTRGGPWFENWQDVPYASDWRSWERRVAERMSAAG